METTQQPDLREHGPALHRLVDELDGELIPLLQAVQHQFGYLPRNVLELIAELTHMPLARIWGVATFYSSFSLTPRGRHSVRVCTGTACHVRGANRVMETLARRIGVGPDGGTSDDLEYTLDTVACVGCCSLAPVVTIDENIHGKLDQQQAAELIATTTGEQEDE